MKNNDKAYIWSCNDFTEEESKLEKLALRLQTVESTYIISNDITLSIDVDKFKEAFAAAQTFNKLLKEGKTEDLVMASVIDDKEEVTETHDDADVNKPHGEEAGDEEKEE